MEHQREAQQPPLPPTPLKCPRCNSTDTKFCYYNNYRKEQPRHYCNTCRRNWTVGGKLRDIPVGGTSRKAKEKTASSSRSDNTRSRAPQTPLQPQGVQTQNPLQMTQALQPVVVASSQQFPVQFDYNQTHGNNGFGGASNNGTTNVEAETTDFDVDQWLNIPDDLPSDACFSHAPK